jgi:hypothetical protein
LSIACSIFLGAFGGGQSDVECSLCINMSSFIGKVTYLSQIDRRNLAKSIGISSFLGFIDTPKFKLSPNVSRRV